MLKDTGQEELLAARYRLAKYTIEIAERRIQVAVARFSLRILDSSSTRRSGGRCRATLQMNSAWILSVSPRLPMFPRHSEKAARIGVWVPWADTDSIGWIRYILDQRKVPYTYLRDEDIRAGAWRNQIDVLIYGHVDLELAEQIHGLPKGWGPMPFKKTAQTPSFGTPAESDDITGGIWWEGLAQIQQFVRGRRFDGNAGQRLDAGIGRWHRSWSAQSSGGVPRSTLAEDRLHRQPHRMRQPEPRSHVRVTFDQPDSPLAYGYPDRTWVFRQNFPLYDVPRKWLRMAYCTTCLDGPEDRSPIVMEWGDRDGAPFVVSGQAWGEDRLIGRPAILDMPAGHGHVVTFNFNPMHRDLNRGDHRLLWNAILNWEAILSAKPDATKSSAEE